MGKKLEINVSSLEQAGKRFVDTWHLAEETDQDLKPEELLSFESLELLLKTLSPKRVELLKLLHAKGATSIRSLSKGLSRDYSNVHSDVKLLESCGLLNRVKEDKVYVPWSEVIAHLSLNTTYKKTFHKRRSELKPVFRRTDKHHKKAS